MHRYSLRLALGRQRPVFSHLSHPCTSVQSTTDPATFPIHTYSTSSSSSSSDPPSSDNSDPSSPPAPKAEHSSPPSFQKTNPPATGQKPTPSANAINNLARLSGQSTTPSSDNLVKPPPGGLKIRRVAFIESFVNPEFEPEASDDSKPPSSKVPPPGEIISVRSLPRRGAGLSGMREGMRNGLRRVAVEGFHRPPPGGHERPQFGERRSSLVYRTRSPRSGSFRSRGRGTGARGRGRGRRMGVRGPEKEGEKKESLADLLKNADWDPAIRQKWKEEASGQPVSFNPKVQFEDLRGWLPALPEADKHAHDANVRRALRDLGGGMPYEPEGYVSSMERAERWRFDDKPIFFASKREKHQVKSLDWMIGRKIPGPSEATKKAILDQVIRGNYEAPKYAPIDDIVELTHSQNVLDRTFRDEDVTKFEDKVKMLLPEYRAEMIESGKLKVGKRQKPKKPADKKVAAPVAAKGSGATLPRAKGKDKNQKQRA